MKAWITGIGWVTAAGKGRGRGPTPFAMPPGNLTRLTRKDVFDQPDQRFGRMDAFSKVGLAAIAYTLRDAGREKWSEKRPIGIVAATVFGCLSTDLDYFDTVVPQGGALASPHLFAYTLPNVFLGEAAIRFGLTGPTLVVTEEDGAGLAAVRLALESIAWGECEAVLAGVCDLPRPDRVATALNTLPGALFFLLEKKPGGISPPHGEVRLAGDGRVLHRGREAAGAAALAAACLAPSEEPRKAFGRKPRTAP